jgi:hypothetical protein
MRLLQAVPQIGEKLKPLYFQHGKKISGNTLLPKEYRFKLLKNIREHAIAYGMKFGVCREGLAELNTAPCDGSWLMPKGKGK